MKLLCKLFGHKWRQNKFADRRVCKRCKRREFYNKFQGKWQKFTSIWCIGNKIATDEELIKNWNKP